MSDIDDRKYRSGFYPAVDQRQALDDRQSVYYVPIYERVELASLDIVRELKDAIEFSAGESVHLLSGFRGSGKTSELLRLVEAVRATGRPAIYLDLEDFLNTEIPLDLGTFPIMLAAGFVSGTGAPSESQLPLRQRFLDLLKRINIEPSIGIDVPNFSVELRLSLRDDNTLRNAITKSVSSNRRTFREELHKFFVEVSADLNGDEAPLFVVDSIDHFRGRAELFPAVRESVERAFSELAEELRLPNIHVVYTVPLYVQSPLGVRHEVLNVKVAHPDGSPYEPGIDAMREVLRCRAPQQDVERLTGEFLDRLIMQSGGHFRDLLRLTGQLIQTTQVLPASQHEINRAEMIIRNDFDGTLSAEKMDILRGIASSHQLTPRNDQWSDAMDLMTNGAILKYPNTTRAWYGVHPLLMPLLES